MPSVIFVPAGTVTDVFEIALTRPAALEPPLRGQSTAQHVNKGKAHQLLQQTSVFEYRFDDDTNLQLLKLYHRRELQHLSHH